MPRYDLSCRVDPYRDGWSLAAFLGHRFRYYPPEVWAARLAEGAVRVNGDAAAGDLRVHRGDRVEYTLWHEEPEVDFTYVVLHEDDDVLAVSKSGNLPVHAGGRYIRHTLIAELRRTRGDSLRLAHRLDRETSGVILLAKHQAAARALEREFHARRVRKEYVAILRGVCPEEMDVDAPIARRVLADGPPMRVVDRDAGKPARTRFLRVAWRRPGDPVSPVDAPAGRLSGDLSLVLVRPESGRTNQIRVHASWAGHPIAGDKIYGRPADTAPAPASGGIAQDGSTACFEVARHLLHCRRLSVRHPRQGLLDLSAPPPPDFEAAWGGPLPSFEVSWRGLDLTSPSGGLRLPGLPSKEELP